MAFFQSARRPWWRPIRFSLPSNDAVRTEATLTLNTDSTAARISTLFASGRTLNATVFCSSFWRMLFSVISGRMRISRGARIAAGSATPEDSVGGLLQARVAASGVASLRERLLERQKARALEHDLPRAEELVDGHVRRRLDREPAHVPRRSGKALAELAHHEERRPRLHAERAEPRQERLRFAVGHRDGLDDGDLPQRELGRDRGPERLPPHRARHILVVAPGCRAEGLAAPLPLGRADRALAGPPGPLLPPRLPPSAGHLAAPLGVVRSGAAVGELAGHRLVQQRAADLDAEDVGLELHRARLLPCRVQHRYGRHGYFFSAAFCCCVLVSFTLFRIINNEPFAPGTAPRTSTRFCSGRTRTTLTFSVVHRAPPIRPGRRWPGHTREGSDDAPIEPGAR